MGRANDLVAIILAERIAEERRAKEAIERALRAGPPQGSGINPTDWMHWHRYGFVSCPGERRDLTCTDLACAIGSRCAKMAALGLHGDGRPMDRKDRPTCGAKTRAGGTCQMRVEPGKRRCRLHGGLSTGPKTAEGKARVVEALRRRMK